MLVVNECDKLAKPGFRCLYHLYMRSTQEQYLYLPWAKVPGEERHAFPVIPVFMQDNLDRVAALEHHISDTVYPL